MNKHQNIYGRHILEFLENKFEEDYFDVIKNYELEQQIELTEHLLNSFELVKKYTETNDSSYDVQYVQANKELSKKYGKALASYNVKCFWLYFQFDIVLWKKGYYTREEFNSLPSQEEQSLNAKEISDFLCSIVHRLTTELMELFLKKKPAFEIRKKIKFVIDNEKNEMTDVIKSLQKGNLIDKKEKLPYIKSILFGVNDKNKIDWKGTSLASLNLFVSKFADCTKNKSDKYDAAINIFTYNGKNIDRGVLINNNKNVSALDSNTINTAINHICSTNQKK